MNPPDQNDHGPPDLLIDPAIWYPAHRRLQTGLVRSLLTNSPPPAANANIPSYVRDGLAVKHARQHVQHNKDTTAPQSSSPPSISVGTPVGQSGGQSPDGDRFSNKDLKNSSSSQVSHSDAYQNTFAFLRHHRETNLSLPRTLEEASETQASTGRSSSRLSKNQSSLSSWSDLLSPCSRLILGGFPQDSISANNHPPSPLPYTDLLSRKHPYLLYSPTTSQHVQQGQIGTPESYNAGLHPIYHPSPNLPEPNQSTTLSALAPVFTSHRPTQSLPQVRLEQIMQTNSWRTSRSAAAALATPPPSLSPSLSSAASATAPARSPRNPFLPGSSPIRQYGPKQRTSINYRGDPANPNNQSADIPDEHNTSVFIENLPPDTTVHGLIPYLRGTGKIYALSVGGPTSRIPTSCAKIVYWERRGVDRLLALCAAGKFVVDGYGPIIKSNWHKTAPQPTSERSRVIIVEGPSSIVNQARLEAFFRAFFKWDKDEVLVHWEGRDGRTRLEYRFASHRAQASEAYRRITQASMNRDSEGGLPGVVMSAEERQLWKEVRVRWGADPCAEK